MFPDAMYKAWLAKKTMVEMPPLAIDHKEHVWLERTLLVYSFVMQEHPKSLCHWCSERGLAQKCESLELEILQN